MGVDLLPQEGPQKVWQPERWTTRHRLVVALSVAGWKNQEIAERTGYGPQRVSQILNDPRAAGEVKRMAAQVSDRVADVHMRLKLLSNEALDEIVDEMRDSADVKIRQKAAFGILDRAGFTPINRNVVVATHIDEKVASRMEAAMEEEKVIEAEYQVLESEELSQADLEEFEE